jgi:hypothetical protein
VAEWLRQNLQNGSRSQYGLEVAAQRDGVSIATLGAANSILASKAPKMENPAHGIGPCRPRKKIGKPVRRQHDHPALGGVMRNFEHLRETKDLATVISKWLSSPMPP